MKIWSVWDERQYGYFARHGRLVSDWALVEQEHIYQYRWISGYVRRRPDDPADTPPVWAWYAYGGLASPAPDLDDEWLLPAGTTGYCVELSIDEQYVLLSQFAMWIEVLNSSYVTSDEHEYDRLVSLESALSAAQAQASREETWPRIFELEFGGDEHWGARQERQIQACLGSIRDTDVVEIRKLTAK